MQYLYNDGTSYVFMDTGTYEQLEVSPEIVGDATNFMLENQEAIVATNDGRVLYIELPASVELEVTYTEPGLQGDRSTGGTKPATVETGATVAVPLFIITGEKIKVDTRDSSYLGRVSTSMSARSKARKRALDLIYASEMRNRSALEALEEQAEDGPVNEYTVELVHGVTEHRDRLDEVISSYVEGWTPRPDAGRRPQRAAAGHLRGAVRRRRA